MGLVLGILGRREEAMEIYRKCAQLDVSGLKDPRTHEATKTSALFNLGRLLADDGRVDEAIEAYLEAVQKMPSHYQPQVSIVMNNNGESKLGNEAKPKKKKRKNLFS
jgi:tetratricopeptide (TPR) repeat protein